MGILFFFSLADSPYAQIHARTSTRRSKHSLADSPYAQIHARTSTRRSNHKELQYYFSPEDLEGILFCVLYALLTFNVFKTLNFQKSEFSIKDGIMFILPILFHSPLTEHCAFSDNFDYSTPLPLPLSLFPSLVLFSPLPCAFGPSLKKIPALFPSLILTAPSNSLSMSLPPSPPVPSLTHTIL